jgi:hypothetical protein
MAKGLTAGGRKQSRKFCCVRLISHSRTISQTGELVVSHLMRSPEFQTALTHRAGVEFQRFVKIHNRFPNRLEMEKIVANGLNHVARRLFEWRTGIDGCSGHKLPNGKQPRLREAVLPIYRDACRRERALREQYFPSKPIKILYFQPSFRENIQELDY